MLNVSPAPVLLALALMLPQVSVQPVVRIGDVARQLSNEDVAEIERLVSNGGGKPWLLSGTQGQIADLRSIDAYLPPEKTTPDLRRGSVVLLLTGSPSALGMVGIKGPAGSTPPRWTAREPEAYGQVATRGRGYNQVEGDDDINRPFRVVGEFDDAELVGLIKFVRSSPSGPSPSSRTPTASVHGGWPVLSVVRQTDSVQVRIRKNDSETEIVTLRRQASDWLVIRITMAIR